MNPRLIIALISAAALGIAITALVSVSKASKRVIAISEAYNNGYEAGARFVVNCYARSNVYLSPLVVSNSMTISNCLFLNYYSWYALGVDNVPTNSKVYIDVKSISVDSTHAIIE